MSIELWNELISGTRIEDSPAGVDLIDEIDKGEAIRWIGSVEPAMVKACAWNGHVDEECVQYVRMALYCEITKTFSVLSASENMGKT